MSPATAVDAVLAADVPAGATIAVTTVRAAAILRPTQIIAAEAVARETAADAPAALNRQGAARSNIACSHFKAGPLLGPLFCAHWFDMQL